MTSSSSPSAERVLEKLEKLQSRLHGKRGIWPPNKCSDVDTHLAGMFLREHIGIFVDALRCYNDQANS
jgi:hypothetical protein